MKYFLSLFLCTFLFVGCTSQEPSPTEITIDTSIEEILEIEQPSLPSNPETTMPNDNPIAIFKTTKGDITVQLLPTEAPNITQNFIDLAKDGKYDGTIFHRVIEGFMIQGGDFENFNGTGGHAAKGGMIEDEFSPNVSHVRGVLSMANRGPNTNGSQFFIMHDDAPHLDGRHSIFGQVTDGMDVVDAIATTSKDGMDRPLNDITVEAIEIQ